MKISRLREATAADHDAVEGAVPLMDPGLNLALYGAVLRRMHGVVAVWERYAEERAPGDLKDMVRARRRCELLEADLRVLGVEPSFGDGAVIPRFASEAEFLGAMYVMEGSRLGGQYIAKHVEEALGLEGGRGDAYFRGFGEHTGAMWKELVGVIEARVADEDEGQAIRAAREMFGVFGAWMQKVRSAE